MVSTLIYRTYSARIMGLFIALVYNQGKSYFAPMEQFILEPHSGDILATLSVSSVTEDTN